MAHYEPGTSPHEIFLGRTFVAGDFICGTGYGAQLVLYTSCAIFLWNTRKIRRQSIFLLAYITVLITIQTLYMIVQVQDIYIVNRHYPEGPWVYFSATQNLPVNVVFYAALSVLTFLSDLLVLWRCWVIWMGAGRLTAYAVVFLPALLLITSFVMGVLWILQSGQPGLAIFSTFPQAYGTSYFAISLGLNILLTILITVRLIMYRRTVLSILPEEYAKDYVSLAAIMTESAALYSILALIFIVTYAIGNPLNQIFLSSASSGQQIAGYLIIYRLAEGRAWTKDTLVKQTQSLPTMHFVSRNRHATNTQLGTLQPNVTEQLSPIPPTYIANAPILKENYNHYNGSDSELHLESQ